MRIAGFEGDNLFFKKLIDAFDHTGHVVDSYLIIQRQVEQSLADVIGYIHVTGNPAQF